MRKSLCGLFLILLTAGCGSPYDTVPVSGVITLNDQPLVDATINTQPIAAGESGSRGPGSFGHTDATGRFELELIDPGGKKGIPGAVPGKHRIYITSEGFSDDPSSDEERTVSNPLPPEYVDGTVTFTVPEEGTDQMNFKIEVRGRRR